MCPCSQCKDARQSDGSKEPTGPDAIDVSKCACISIKGVQCSAAKMPDKEWCYECSAGYCDCECEQCAEKLQKETAAKQQHTTEASSAAKARSSIQERALKQAKNSREARKKHKADVQEIAVQQRIASSVQQAQREWWQNAAMQSDKRATEKVVHEHGLEWAGMSNSQAAQVLGLEVWGSEPPLQRVGDALTSVDSQEPDQTLAVFNTEQHAAVAPFSLRATNSSATLEEYEADRAEAEADNNAEWRSRVRRRHVISSSSSPEMRRSQRAQKPPERFRPGMSASPIDDSSSYSDTEMQDALQQRGIPALIGRTVSRTGKGPVRRKLKTKKVHAGAKFVPPCPLPRIPRPRPLRPEHRLPSSRDVAVSAAKRTKQLKISSFTKSPSKSRSAEPKRRKLRRKQG